MAQWVVLPKKRTSKDKIEHIVGLTLHTETYYTFLERFFYNKKLFCIFERSLINIKGATQEYVSPSQF